MLRRSRKGRSSRLCSIRFWTPPWTLGGSFLWDAVRGVGVSVTLNDPGGKIARQQTLWDADLRVSGDPELEPPTAFGAAHARLAIGVAAWLAYVRAEAAPAERSKLEAAAATSWRSYALFRIGAQAQAAAQVDDAQMYYVRAKALDPGNAGANFNAAILRLSGKSRPGEPAARYLDDAEFMLDRVSDALDASDAVGIAKESNGLYFRYLYNDALVKYERARVSGTQALGWDVPIHAAKLAATAAGDAADASPEPDSLRRLIDLVEEAAFALFGGALAARRAHERGHRDGSGGPHRRGQSRYRDSDRGTRRRIAPSADACRAHLTEPEGCRRP